MKKYICVHFELTQKLAKELNLHCNLSIDKSPITLGTVFWARSDALEKILKKEWKYEDFDEEPLKDDGTISHVIERIIG
ncbi:rhamnan synthesis protein F, partial [Clostridiaceae bacterium]|nr:rhamnan synthesis protein F [Clostridiaceae bacterium]